MTRVVDPAFAAHLQGTKLTVATCWRIARKDSVVLGFTDHDEDLILDGVTYRAATGISRSAIDGEAGLRVGNLEITGLLRSDVITAADISAGKYRGAEVWVFRVNWANSDQGILKLMRGTLGRMTARDNDYVAELEGLAKRLTNEIVELYSTECLADLGDERCRASSAVGGPYQTTGTITAVVHDRVYTTSLGQPDGWWENAVVTWTSGGAAGLTSDVRAQVGGEIELLSTPGLPITVGTTFSIKVGCDKKISTCVSKFDNLLNFRGFGVHMPGEDELLWYPDAQAE